MTLSQLADTGHRLPASPAQNRDVIGENTRLTLRFINVRLCWDHKADVMRQQRKNMVSQPTNIGSSSRANAVTKIRLQVAQSYWWHFVSIGIDQIRLTAAFIGLYALIRNPHNLGYIAFSRLRRVMKQWDCTSKEEAIDCLDHLRCRAIVDTQGTKLATDIAKDFPART